MVFKGPKEKIIKVNGNYKRAAKIASVPFDRKKFDYESNAKSTLEKIRLDSIDRDISRSRKFLGYGAAGFVGSFASIVVIGLTAMIIISLMSPDTNLTFKGFMQALANIRFRNSWFSSLNSINDAWKELNNFKPEFPGGIGNILTIFTSFFHYIFNFGNVIYSIISGLFNLLMDFIINILEILEFLMTLGANIT